MAHYPTSCSLAAISYRAELAFALRIKLLIIIDHKALNRIIIDCILRKNSILTLFFTLMTFYLGALSKTRMTNMMILTRERDHLLQFEEEFTRRALFDH